MIDSKNLYFIPIIERAFKSDGQKRAMRDAFEEIKAMGKLPEYKVGFRQFLEFINAVMKISIEDPSKKYQLLQDIVEDLLYDVATNTFQGDIKQKQTLIEALEDISGWRDEFERIKRETEFLSTPEKSLKVEIMKKDKLIGAFPISQNRYSISKVTPGRHAVRLSNGRILWEGDLKKEELIWSFAFPEQDFRMAAETERPMQEPTRKISLLDGEFIINIYAGIEAGQITIENEKRNSK